MYGYEDSRYLLRMMREWIEERLYQIYFIKEMQNPMDLVTQEKKFNYSDTRKLETLYDELKETSQRGQPLFAHLHLMGTHGLDINPSIRKFSIGKEQNENSMTDFYDDAILSFDARVEELVNFLKGTGQYQKTILIIYTDHGQQWVTNKRLPLIIHFPNDDFHGIITANTQNIDIAPTILDYLNIPIPEWMEGDSILKNLDRKRLIFSVQPVGGDNFSIYSLEKFKEIGIIQCQKWFSFDYKERKTTFGIIKNYSNPCSGNDLDALKEIQEQLKEKLIYLRYQLPN